MPFFKRSTSRYSLAFARAVGYFYNLGRFRSFVGFLVSDVRAILIESRPGNKFTGPVVIRAKHDRSIQADVKLLQLVFCTHRSRSDS